jgi:hypothetical protein
VPSDAGVAEVPAFFVVQCLARAAGKPSRSVSVPTGLAAIAWEEADAIHVLVSNLTRNTVELPLQPATAITAAILDEARLARGAIGSCFDDRREITDGKIRLSPYAVALIELTNVG